jgi:hypothetical protein
MKKKVPVVSKINKCIGLLSIGMTGMVVVCTGVDLFAAEGDPYTWPSYTPSINYNFRDDFPSLAVPSKELDMCSGVTGTQSDGWWTFKWGAKKNSLITEKAITPLLARMNKDFAYFRDTMGWPPDKCIQDGYKSTVYLFGSGLCTDNASNTEKGGWQSSVGKYPIVLLSYYPVYCFDPSCTYTDRVDQTGACVHEGIHCILASMPGAKQAAWFQEGGNTWLQQQAYAQQSNDYRSMGFLNATQLIAPFMPIECYSGWLQDGSFGGPSAEGVDKFEGSQQICTWRKLLGGNQYGNLFPTFLGEWLGLGSIPWIWKNCPGRVLEGMAARLGEQQIRHLITEYRARLALLDMKKWSNACKQLINDNFGSSIGPEWSPYWINCDAWKATPYTKTTDDGSGVLTPEQQTTPGWSGANQVPFKVSGSIVTIDFQPIGKNMSCQLCYRTTEGIPVYSTPVTSGKCSLRLDKAPNKNVIIAVICNTDYKYLGEETRKAHFDYRLKLVEGISGTADIYTKWYDVDLRTETETPEQPTRKIIASSLLARLHEDNSTIVMDYSIQNASEVSFSLISASGRVLQRKHAGNVNAGFHSDHFNFASAVAPGIYIIEMNAGKNGGFARTVLVK